MEMSATALNPASDEVVVRPLTGVTGAEIFGLRMDDGRQETAEFIKQAVLKHHVVAIRDQFLKPEDQLKFGAHLGPTTYTRMLVRNTEWHDIYRVENKGKKLALTEHWHTDGTTSERPPSFTIMAAQVLPRAGGDTMFANMVYAYETLSETFKGMLKGLRCKHGTNMANVPGWAAPDAKPVEAEHPIVRMIPETGLLALYAGATNRYSSGWRWISGMTREESDSILDFLSEHSLRNDGVYRHRWMPGDVVMWDNRTTLHCAPHDYGDEERTLNRLMIEGERPIGPA